MAAVVEIDEVNGTAPGTRTHGTTHTRMGSVDQVNLDPDAGNNAIVAGDNGIEKWKQQHLTALDGAVKVKNLKCWCPTSPPANTVFGFNGHETQATYDTTKKTTYETPGVTAAKTPNALPLAEPAGANIGIGGSLTGELTAAGFGDFILLQVRPSALATVSADPQITYQYDEVV